MSHIQRPEKIAIMAATGLVTDYAMAVARMNDLTNLQLARILLEISRVLYPELSASSQQEKP